MKSESHLLSRIQPIGMFCLLLMLASCAAPPKTAVVKTTQPEAEPTPVTLNAEHFIEQSKKQTGSQAFSSLLTASEQLLVEGKPLDALWLANQLHSQVIDGEAKYRLLLVKADALLALAQAELALAQLQKAQTYTELLDTRFYQLAATTYRALGFPVKALDAQLFAFSHNNQANEQDIEALWQTFQQLAPWQLTTISQSKAPYLGGWLQLTKYANRFGGDASAFDRYLRQWRRQFPTHPANGLVNEILATEKFTPIGAQRIAVILPFPGASKRQEVRHNKGF